jgi:hypothetical protein
MTNSGGGGALPNLGQAPALSLAVFAAAAVATILLLRRRAILATGFANPPPTVG